MAREKSAVLWGSAVANEVIQKIVEAVQDLALPITPDEVLGYIRNDRELAGRIARLIYDKAIPPLSVVVENDRPIRERIKEERYDEYFLEKVFDSLEIIKGNPADFQGKRVTEIRLIHPRWMEELNTMDLRHATLAELLPLRTACRGEEYAMFEIFALGTSWKSPSGDQLVAYLDYQSSEPILGFALPSLLFNNKDMRRTDCKRLAVTPKEH